MFAVVLRACKNLARLCQSLVGGSFGVNGLRRSSGRSPRLVRNCALAVRVLAVCVLAVCVLAVRSFEKLSHSTLSAVVSPPLPASLDPAQLRLATDEFGRLTLELPDGARHVGVTPIRAFPTADPGRFIAFCDPQGRELLMLDSLDQLPAQTRAILEAELARREFQPVITRILEARAGSSQTDWRVETERGVASFATTTEEQVRGVGEHAVQFTDSHGIRYRIPDVRGLDPHSRKVLRRFL